MKKIILFTFCTFLPLASHAQTAVEKALVNLVKPTVAKEATIVIPATTGNAISDMARITRAVSEVANRQYSAKQVLVELTQKAQVENRATIPEALLAHEILQKEPVMFYNATQVSSLWYFFKDVINESRCLLVRYNKQYFYQIRPGAEGAIEKMKAELKLQTQSADKRIYSQKELDDRLTSIREWKASLKGFADNNFKEKSTFFLQGYDALSWLEYYYRTLNGENCEIPGSLWKTWQTQYRHVWGEGW